MHQVSGIILCRYGSALIVRTLRRHMMPGTAVRVTGGGGVVYLLVVAAFLDALWDTVFGALDRTMKGAIHPPPLSYL